MDLNDDDQAVADVKFVIFHTVYIINMSDKEMQNYISYLKGLPSQYNYNSNKEYRNVLRIVFRMDSKKVTPYADFTTEELNETIDDESRDEMQCDMDQIGVCLTEIYKKTKDETIFQNMYKKAAGQMLSEDPTIGQTVLCSYDYFALYYSCLWYYFQAGTTGLETSVEYKRLSEIIK